MTGLRRRFPWVRLGRLGLGTVAMGVGIALLVASRLGVTPMDGLHLAIAHACGWDLGRGILLTQAFLLLTFIPLRIRPGVATIVGFIVPAFTADAVLALLPTLANLAEQLAALAVGGVLFCAGVAIYLLSRLGQLPRDGLMLALGGDRNVAGRNSRRLALSRIGIDSVFVGLATLILGPSNAVHAGILSVGTLALAVLCGPMIARGLIVIARVPGFSPQPVRTSPRHGTDRRRPVDRAKHRRRPGPPQTAPVI
ncbi:Uncharacterised protein [Amycolatopsis camponoti]|uniref:Integral membrane protein n=1 Tax=Amycolatopsis camponoti TaxID=2606593 RepID=A0A6I8M3Z8_9PSEU|nr:hypothetical protein [Amycolatopsis camponoti]VVJ22729.1 Uncharacterised protein [Amycolatopsis camponoti]